MTLWQVLVVDDEEMNLEIVSAYLEDGPYAVELAASGEAALDRLQTRETVFDLVILDRMLPGIGGIDVLRWIQADRRYARIPVILQTAAARPEDIVEGVAAGAQYYLTKPFMTDDLLGIVGAALHDLKMERDLAAAVAEAPADGLAAGTAYPFANLAEADRLAVRLAALCPDPAAVAVGLAELMENAVEHGIADIGYAEKGSLLKQQRWLPELASRLALAENRGRHATVSFRRSDQDIVFAISDPGSGFAWQDYLAIEPARACAPNGRGIARAASLAFAHRLHYEDDGRRAIAAVSRT